MLVCRFKIALRQPETLCLFSFFFPSTLFCDVMEPSHLRHACVLDRGGRISIQSEFQSAFTENMENMHLIDDQSLKQGSDGIAKSTLNGINRKGSLCDPYQTQRRLQF